MKIYKITPVDPELCDELDEYDGPHYFGKPSDAIDAAFQILPPPGSVLKEQPEPLQIVRLEIEDGLGPAGIAALLNQDEEALEGAEIICTVKAQTEGEYETGYYMVTDHVADYEE